MEERPEPLGDWIEEELEIEPLGGSGLVKCNGSTYGGVYWAKLHEGRIARKAAEEAADRLMRLLQRGQAPGRAR